MKRGGPLKRTAFKRTRPMRRRFRSTSYSRRKRYPEYMRAVKRFPCCAAHLGRCEGVVEADHAGRRGMGQKCHDREVIPICTKHHFERGNFCGDFKRFDQEAMREFLEVAIEETQLRARQAGIEVPPLV